MVKNIAHHYDFRDREKNRKKGLILLTDGYLHSLDYPFAFYLTIANKKSPLMLRGRHGIT